MAITMKNPYGYRSVFDELNDAFGDLFWGDASAGNRFPALNAWVSDHGVVVDAELPGIDPKNLDISVVGDELTLTGRRDPDEAKESDTYHRRERRFGRFTRSLRLPFKVEAAKVTANYRHGVLRITLPRAEADKPKRIAIEGA